MATAQQRQRQRQRQRPQHHHQHQPSPPPLLRRRSGPRMTEGEDIKGDCPPNVKDRGPSVAQ
eukprot:3527661-Pleurochrysis_carterae.AAC.1